MSSSGLFLPDGYVENAANSADADGTPFWTGGVHDIELRWQEPVYRFASGVYSARFRRGQATVLDVGCGTGHKLVRYFSGLAERVVGMDQASALARAPAGAATGWIEGDLRSEESWSMAASVGARLILCSDVIEHVPDPVDLLDRLHRLASAGGTVVLSTPDRSRLEGAQPLGPPGNDRHIREWTMTELQGLVRSRGFNVVSARHLLPRSYARSRGEARRWLGRLRRHLPVPDPRSCAVLELQADVRA